MLKQLLAYSYLTTKIGRIVSPLHQHQETSKLHIFLKAPFGFTKTTEMLELVEKGIAHIVLEHTEAGLLGSAKGNVYYQGDLVRGANKITVIDEYYLFEDKARRHLLTLMSHGFAKRTIQTFSKTGFSERGDGWEIVGDTSGFTLKINTAFALSTAQLERTGDVILEMIQSRCFNINYAFSKDEALKILSGEKVSNKVKIKNVEPIDQIALPENVAKYLVQYIDKYGFVPEDIGGYYIRAYWDITKIASTFALQENRTEVTKEDVDRALIYYPLHQLGFLGNKLTKSEISVYMNCNYKNTSMISKEVGLSERQVRRIIQKLRELKLVTEVQIGKNKIYVRTIEANLRNLRERT